MAKVSGSGAQHPAHWDGQERLHAEDPRAKLPLGPARRAPSPWAQGVSKRAPLSGLLLDTLVLHTCPGQQRLQDDLSHCPQPGMGCSYCWGHRSPGAFSAGNVEEAAFGANPWTETCPRSKITTGNPKGLSLATHQTAFVEKHTDGRGHRKAPNGTHTSTDLRIPRKRRLLWKRSCFRRSERVCRLLSNSRIKKTNQQKKPKNSSGDPARD